MYEGVIASLLWHEGGLQKQTGLSAVRAAGVGGIQIRLKCLKIKRIKAVMLFSLYGINREA